jgi:uncharacterized protein YlxP (DUF503 family)
MDKSSKKKSYSQYNPAIINKLKQKYGLTVQFIGQSLRGERTSDTSFKICEDYKLMEREINKVIQKS